MVVSYLKVDFTAKTKALSAEINTNFTNLLSHQICNEDFSALTNGTLQTFTTALKFKPGTLRVFGSRTIPTVPAGHTTLVDGLRMRPGADFTENLDVNGDGISFTMTVIPGASTLLIADYQRAQNT